MCGLAMSLMWCCRNWVADSELQGDVGRHVQVLIWSGAWWRRYLWQPRQCCCGMPGARICLRW